jgi:hypothetical protein
MPDPQPTPPSRSAPRPAPLAVLFAAWLVPGAGHFLLGRRLRGALFLVFVVATTAIGVAITSGAAVSPTDHPYALVAELPAGLVALVPAALEWLRAHHEPLSDATIANLDLGMVFCMMAGLWNALLAHDAFDRALERRTR